VIFSNLHLVAARVLVRPRELVITPILEVRIERLRVRATVQREHRF
jgi:hypothetical protein